MYGCWSLYLQVKLWIQCAAPQACMQSSVWKCIDRLRVIKIIRFVLQRPSEYLQAGVGINEIMGETRQARKKPRLLKSQSILAEAHAIKPAIPHQQHKQKGPARRPKQLPQQLMRVPKAARPAAASSAYDIWDEADQPEPQGQLVLQDSLILDRDGSGVLRIAAQTIAIS